MQVAPAAERPGAGKSVLRLKMAMPAHSIHAAIHSRREKLLPRMTIEPTITGSNLADCGIVVRAQWTVGRKGALDVLVGTLRTVWVGISM